MNFQGGLEIPCTVRVSLPASIRGDMLIQKYKSMVEELYCQPKQEVIMGSFLKKKPKGCADIREMFKKAEERNKATTIEID